MWMMHLQVVIKNLIMMSEYGNQNKGYYSKKIEGRKFSHLLLAHQAQTNLPSVAVPGPSTPKAQLPALMSY